MPAGACGCRSSEVPHLGTPEPHRLSLNGLVNRSGTAADGGADQSALLAAGNRTDTGAGACAAADDERSFLPRPLRLSFTDHCPLSARANGANDGALDDVGLHVGDGLRIAGGLAVVR